MSKTALRKEKWTLSFEPRLKAAVVREAKRNGVYPVSVLEQLVRDRFNPFGHSDVQDAPGHVRSIRSRSNNLSDRAFLDEIRAWQKSVS